MAIETAAEAEIETAAETAAGAAARARAARPAAAGRRPKLIYLVTEDWYFWSHRLPMAEAARAAGFDVAVATRVAEHGPRIEAAGFTLHPLSWQRRSVGPAAALSAVAEIRRLYRRERPDIVHHVALKPVLLGGLAAAAAGVPAVVSALTGLGYLFTAETLKARLLRRPVGVVLARLLDRPNGMVVVQNEDDRQTLLRRGLASAGRVAVIRGSGIDTARFRVLPEPPEPPVVAAFVGRMLEDKGVRSLVEAQQRVQAAGLDLRLLLVGAGDPENPGSIAEAELACWSTLPGIAWLGHCGDIRAVWEAAHIAVLPSRREGLPKSLLEAAACGRPIVATDVPGCREIARRGENALLVPPDDAPALAAALAALAGDAALRRRFGAASRALVESDLAAERVGAATVALYIRLLDTRLLGTAGRGHGTGPGGPAAGAAG